MSVIACVLASGALLCVLPLGLVLARALGYRRRSAARALATPLGVATVSIPLALCAVLGVFRPGWIGAAGWCVAIGACAWLVTRGDRPLPGAGGRSGMRLVAVAAIVGCAAVLYLGFPAESPLGGRDEGLHSLAGLSLERTGTLVIARPEALALAPALFAPFVQGLEFHLPGIPAASVLKPQFSPLLPSWIAQLHAAGGDRWLYRINALFTLAAIGVFYRLARRLVRPPFAVLALAVFALNPAQVWIARINLSEPLGELLALGAILLAVDALRSRNDLRILASAALFGVACSVRLDLAIVTPLLFAAAFAALLGGSPRDAAGPGMLFRLAAATLAAQAVAVIALAAWSPAYAMDHAFAPASALAASAALTLGYGVARRRSFGWAPATRRRFAVVFVLLLCAGFVYAAFVRPHVGSFAMIPGQSAVAGLRDYREESLRNLATYLAWPTLLLALAGMSVAVVRVLTKRTDAAMALLVTLAAGINGILLVAPLVSPDHFWAIRRFATLAIPLVVLMAAWGVQCAARASVGWRYGRATAALVIATIAAMLWMQRATLFVRENAGLTAQLRALDASLPGGSLIVRDFDALATTFALGFGRAVLPLRDAHVEVDAAAQSFWRSCATTRCTLVHASFDGLRGLHAGPTQVASLTRRYIAPTYTPLPTKTATETIDLLATPILGLASDAPPPRNAGAVRDWRLSDRGFYRDEPGATHARWTDGDAELALPTWRADALELRLAAASGAPSRDVRIELSGRRVFDGRLTPGEHLLTFPLDSGSVAPPRLTIRGNTFVPSTLRLNSDRRTLSVVVRAVRLIDATVMPMTPTAPAAAYRSAIDVPGGLEQLPRRVNRAQALRVTIEVENRGTMTWPALGEVEIGAPHVALGIAWSRPGERERLLEQRQQLPYSLRPGERVRIDVPIDPRELAGISDGTVEVGIGLVHEGVAWFAERGDATIKFPLEIVR